MTRKRHQAVLNARSNADLQMPPGAVAAVTVHQRSGVVSQYVNWKGIVLRSTHLSFDAWFVARQLNQALRPERDRLLP